MPDSSTPPATTAVIAACSIAGRNAKRRSNSAASSGRGRKAAPVLRSSVDRPKQPAATSSATMSPRRA